ncbi:hypothetical protein ScPMuIL_011464 [Solemya velum]
MFVQTLCFHGDVHWHEVEPGITVGVLERLVLCGGGGVVLCVVGGGLAGNEAAQVSSDLWCCGGQLDSFVVGGPGLQKGRTRDEVALLTVWGSETGRALRLSSGEDRNPRGLEDQNQGALGRLWAQILEGVMNMGRLTLTPISICDVCAFQRYGKEPLLFATRDILELRMDGFGGDSGDDSTWYWGVPVFLSVWDLTSLSFHPKRPWVLASLFNGVIHSGTTEWASGGVYKPAAYFVVAVMIIRSRFGTTNRGNVFSHYLDTRTT